MTSPGNLELTSDAFAKRLANLLVASRVHDGRSLAAVARASGGRYTRHQLRGFEQAGTPLDDDTVEQLAALYECDLAAILPERLTVVIQPPQLILGGVAAEFEPHDHHALLTAYLLLVRTLRRQRSAPAVDLRRDDIEALAGYLGEPSEQVLARLGSLMNATQSKRAAMAGLFATGAMVVGLVGTAAAVGNVDESVRPGPPTVTVTTTVDEAPSTTGVPTTDRTTTTSTAVPTTAVPTTAVTTSVPDTTAVSSTPVVVTTVPIVRPPTVPPTTAPPTRPATTTTIAIISTDVPLPTSTTAVVDPGLPPVPPKPTTTTTTTTTTATTAPSTTTAPTTTTTTATTTTVPTSGSSSTTSTVV
jgi:hypothetical protein